MKTYMCLLVFGIISFILCGKGEPGVLAPEEVVANGKINLADPLFSKAVNWDSVFGDEVQFLLGGGKSLEQTVKVDILRSALAAQENLSDARFSLKDVSSRKLYESLVMYDLVSSSVAFSPEEKAGLKKTLSNVLSYYIGGKKYDWDKDYWSLGASAMRVAASCILYSLDFPEDPAGKKILEIGTAAIEKNLGSAVDDFGGWLVDSPGYADEAVEYMVIAAKALKTAGIADHFSNPRFMKLFLYEMNLLPPQQCPLVQGRFMIVGSGDTNPGINHGSHAVMAAGDLYHQYPDEASYIIWFWKQCGSPVTPLGLLFIDNTIPYMRPDNSSMVTGRGGVVLRNQFNTPDETFISIGFGTAWGVCDRDDSDQADHGDFSFVWSGIPLAVHDGFVEDACSQSLFNRKAARHNTVIFSGAGDSPMVPETEYSNGNLIAGKTGPGTVPADFYPDGLSQFLTTGQLDYAAGPVRLSEGDLPSPYHYRHFVYLKPDALLIWDQVESSYPLEWNLWMPVSSAVSDGNRLLVHTSNDTDLSFTFVGDSNIDYYIDEQPFEMTAAWPLMARTSFGDGEMTVVTLDITASAFTGVSSFGRDLLANLTAHSEEPRQICLITDNNALKTMLNSLQLPLNHVEPGEIAESDLSLYDLFIVDITKSADQLEELSAIGDKLSGYVSKGGRIIWFCHSDIPLRQGTIHSPGMLPVHFEYNGCGFSPDGSFNPRENISLSDDPVLMSPNTLSGDIWNQAFTKLLPKGAAGDEKSFTISVPSSWSDEWKVLASVKKTFPITVSANAALGNPSRIRVKHPASKDFFTLLLPAKAGESDLYTISKQETGHIVFSDPVTTWEVKAGKTSWTDANLSVSITREGKTDALYAFDCTTITSGQEKITAESPISIWYDPKNDTGILSTAADNTVRFGRGSLKIHAGEVTFNGLRSSVALERQTFLSTLRVTGNDDKAVVRARIYLDKRFMGTTDPQGEIPLRWNGAPPSVTVKYQGGEASASLVPGVVTIKLP